MNREQNKERIEDGKIRISTNILQGRNSDRKGAKKQMNVK
jgi:hypothetical protein